jgi:hypothetical protein
MVSDIKTCEVSTIVTEPKQSKKRKFEATTSPNRLQMMNTFSMKQVLYQGIVKSTKCNVIPMKLNNTKQSSVLVQISGGGMIPKSFGVEETEDDAKKKKVSIKLQVSSDDDYNQMVRIRGETIDCMSDNWSTWNSTAKKPSHEVLENFCNHIVQPKKLKKNSSAEFWDGIINSKINATDLQDGKCRIVDVDTREPVSHLDIPGRKWSKAIFEFKQVYILGTKSFGVTKLLRYLSTSKVDDDEDFDPL